jgi:multidrug resistance efflux pump
MNGTRCLQRRFVVIALVAFAATVAGAGWALRASNTETAVVNSNVAADAGLVCFGHVDVESGIVGLSPAQAGRVVSIDVRENQTVQAGDVLLRIDDRQARLRVQQAEASLKAAQVQLDQAKELPGQHRSKLTQQAAAVNVARYRVSAAHHQLDRKRELYRSENLNSRELAAAAELVGEVETVEQAEKEKLRELQALDPRLAVKRADAEVSVARGRLAEAELALEECRLKAPCKGTILRLQTHVGDLIGGQSLQPAVLFCPNETRIVRAEVSQEFAHQVQTGAACRIADDSTSDAEWWGKVVRISDWYTHRRSILLEPSQHNDVRTLECIVELDPGQPPVRIGQRMRVMMGRSSRR